MYFIPSGIAIAWFKNNELDFSTLVFFVVLCAKDKAQRRTPSVTLN